MISETHHTANSNFNPSANTLRHQQNRNVPDLLTDDRRLQPQNPSRINNSQRSSASTGNNGGFGALSCCPCHPCPCPCHQRSPETSTAAKITPTDEELITDYLLKKISNQVLPKNKISDVDIYTDHPEKLVENHPQEEYGKWYFFWPRNKSYEKSNRVHRKAGLGYWKLSGNGIKILNGDGDIIGHKNYLVYYEGISSRKRTKTDWIMHEYVVNDCMKFCDYALYKIYNKKNYRNVKEFEQVNLANSNDEEDDQTPSIREYNQDPNASDLHHQRNHEHVRVPDNDAQDVLLPIQQPGSIYIEETNPITLQFENNLTFHSPLNYGFQTPLMLQNDLIMRDDMRYALPVVHQPIPPLIPVYAPAPASFQTYPGGNLVLSPESCYNPAPEINNPGPSYNLQFAWSTQTASPPLPYHDHESHNGNNSGLIEYPSMGFYDDGLQDYVSCLHGNERNEGWLW